MTSIFAQDQIDADTDAAAADHAKEPHELPDYDDVECWNCGGEGFTYGCNWEWQCDTWDGDSCLCTRRCEWCTPISKEELEEHREMRRALSDAITATCERCHGTKLLHHQACGSQGLSVPCPKCAIPEQRRAAWEGA